VSAKPFYDVSEQLAEKAPTMAYDFGEVWRCYPFVKHIIEADVLEERLSLDFLSVFLAGAEATIWIALQKLLTDMLSTPKPLITGRYTYFL
jgi:hypothetical protein